MSEPIELIASTANWLTHPAPVRSKTLDCMYPTKREPPCLTMQCEECIYAKRIDTTEIVNVLYRPFK